MAGHFHSMSKMGTRKELAGLILTVRSRQVILDRDLARVYGVETRALNQAVKRNLDRFPDDFMFELNRDEILGISQSVTSLKRLKFSKQARVFTEHGALQVANILSSDQAVSMSVLCDPGFCGTS